MFMPTIAGQGTEEQKKLYLEPAIRHEIIGCYAQTEVSGVEKETREKMKGANHY
jgi:alkylation response protein AidB-like acyl-CoA dehydrogenase